MKSPIIELLQQLLYAPDPDAQHISNRIRLMERDIGVTTKVIILGLLGYALYFQPDVFAAFDHLSGSDSAELALATVRGAFLSYCVLNLIVIGMLLAMTWLPLTTLQWAVFIMNLMDAIFVSLLVNLTGGLESTFYWVFLCLIVRNSISVPQHRYQVAINLLVITCYIFSPVIGSTIENIVEQVNQPESVSQEVATAISTNEVVVADTNFATSLSNNIATATNPAVRINGTNVTRRHTVNLEGTELNFKDALLAAMFQLTDPRQWQSKLIRIVLLALLSLCCYGISVLWNYQLQQRAEEEEFASRQHQLRSTGRLAAEIAHRLKNPLAIINNAVFSLRRALPDAEEKVNQKIEMIKEEVDRSDQILTELMGYAKLADAKVERLNIRPAIEHAKNSVFPSGYEHDIRITTDIPEMLPPLLMQRLHLSEILVNLLTNAREALSGKGELKIQVEVNQGENIRVRLTDNGPGMSANKAEKIFDAFYSTSEKGTGLGLAIVRHNAEIYGGKVEVESELGKGTSFILTFPFKATAPQES